MSQSHTALIRELSRPLEPLPTGVEPRLPALVPAVRAVLFDLYGTLFVSGASGETAPGLGAEIARRHAASRAAGEPFPEVDLREVWRAVLGGPDRGDADIEAHAVRQECTHNPVWPMPGLTSTLEALRDAGLAMGVISNAQFMTPLLLPALANKNMEALGFDPDLCLWSYRERRAKPSPALFAEAAARLAARGIGAGETLFVGNCTRNDIAPAAAAGFRTALFAGCARSLRDGGEALPDLVVTELPQLVGIARPGAMPID